MLEKHNDNIMIILMNQTKSEDITKRVSKYLSKVKTNRDLAIKEIWFVAEKLQDFF